MRIWMRIARSASRITQSWELRCSFLPHARKSRFCHFLRFGSLLLPFSIFLANFASSGVLARRTRSVVAVRSCTHIAHHTCV